MLERLLSTYMYKRSTLSLEVRISINKQNELKFCKYICMCMRYAQDLHIHCIYNF